jgi:hypothetical protein
MTYNSRYLIGNSSATKPHQLMLFGETVAVYCENHTEHTNTIPNNIYESSSYLTGNIYVSATKTNQ